LIREQSLEQRTIPYAWAFMALYWISCVLLGRITVTLTLLEHRSVSMSVLLPLCQYDRLQDTISFLFGGTSWQ